MQLRVTIRMPDNTLSHRVYYGADAFIDARNVLQIYRGRIIIAQYSPNHYVSWEYYTPPFQSTSRAEQVLRHHEK
jgi:hypothetical protein